MNSGRQAPHFSEGMLISASLLLSFFFFSQHFKSACRVCSRPVRGGRLCSRCFLRVSAWRRMHGGVATAATLPPRGESGGGSDAGTGAGAAPPPFPPRAPSARLEDWIGRRLGRDARPAAWRGKPLPEGEVGPRPVAASSCLEPCACRRARAEAMALGPFHSRRQVRGAAAWPERRSSMRRGRQGLPSRSPSLHASRSGSMHATRIWPRTIAGSPRTWLVLSFSSRKTAKTSSGSRARPHPPPHLWATVPRSTPLSPAHST